MSFSLRTVWAEMVQPLLSRPKPVQVAALCHRVTDGARQVLLITSRDTGRWILPKGWPIAGLDDAAAAKVEAWEEAGVKDAKVNPKSIGQFDYDKRLENGVPVRVQTHVFSLKVKTLADAYPESDERRRTWVSPDKAAQMVHETGLKSILRNL